MGVSKRGSAWVGAGCGLAVAVAVVAALPAGPADDDPTAAVSEWVTLTSSDDGDEDGEDRGDDGGDDESLARAADGTGFVLEIDPELDARFGPRPVNAVRAAEIATARFGGRVVEAELDEEGGRPVWEVELAGAAVDEVVVDALDGRIR